MSSMQRSAIPASAASFSFSRRGVSSLRSRLRCASWSSPSIVTMNSLNGHWSRELSMTSVTSVTSGDGVTTGGKGPPTELHDE